MVAVRVSVIRVKEAVTDLAAAMVTMQVLPVVVSQPVQLVKVEPVDAVAVRVTSTPSPKEALHVLPQVMPDGLLDIVPLPVPSFEIVRG